MLFREAGPVEIALAQHGKLDLVGPKGKPRPVRVFRCSAAKATKRAREVAETAAAKGEGPPGSGSRGWQQRERHRDVETKKALVKPKLSAATKLKKERKEKVETKRKHKLAKRSGGAAAVPKGAIGKKGGGGGGSSGKKGGGKPSSL